MDEFGSPKHSAEYIAENKGPRIIIVAMIMTTLTSLFVVGRIYSKCISSRKLAVDDYIIILSMAICWSYFGLSVAAIHYGNGRHADVLAPENLKKAIFFLVVSFFPAVLSFVVPKYAVIILIAKLLNPSRKHKVILWINAVHYGLLSVGMLALNFTQCSPVAYQWDPSIEGGTCIDRNIFLQYSFALGVYSAFLDIYLAVYPAIVLLKLQMPWTKKIALTVALGFGFCAGAVTIYKCKMLPSLMAIQDFTFANDGLILWTNIEANCVIIGACIPTMAPLARKVFGNSFLGGDQSGQSSKKPTHDLVTIGSTWRIRGKKDDAAKLSREDMIGNDHDSRDIILEEREVIVTYANKEGGQGGPVKKNGSGTNGGEYGARITEPNW